MGSSSIRSRDGGRQRRRARRARGRRSRRAAGHPRPRLPGVVVVVAPPAARRWPTPATTSSPPTSAATAARPGPSEVDAYGIDALCGDLLGLLDEAGHEQARVRRPRLGRADRVGPGPAASRAGPGRGRRERALPVLARPADRGADGALRRPLLLHPLLPGRRTGRGRAGGRHPRRRWLEVLWGQSGDGLLASDRDSSRARAPASSTAMPTPPPLPWPWLTEDDLDRYAAAFEQSGFFGRSATTATSTPTTTAWPTCPPSLGSRCPAATSAATATWCSG